MNFASVSGKNWIFKKFDTSDVKKYSEQFSLSEITARLLAIRKNNIENINLFLNPTIKNLLPNPFHLKDMKKAVNATYKNINEKNMIAIFLRPIILSHNRKFANMFMFVINYFI